MRKVVFFCFLIISSCRHRDQTKTAPILPQPPTVSQGSDLYFKQIGAAEGLPSTQIWQAYHDHFGYSWISTDKAIARYNAYELKLFLSSPDDKLDMQGASSFFEDKNGILWMLSGAGNLHWFDRDKDQFVHVDSHFENGWSIEKGHSFSEEKNGDFWLSAYGGLQYMHLKNSNLEAFPVMKIRDPSWPHEEKQHFETICDDGHGKLWLGTRKFGLVTFDKRSKKYHFYRDEPKYLGHMLDEWITDILPASDGFIWVADLYAGVYLLNTNSGEIVKRLPLEDLVSETIHKKVNPWDLTLEGDVLYIATAEHGLLLYDILKGSLLNQYWPEQKGVAVKSISRDYLGDLWLIGNKVNIGSPSFYSFKTFETPEEIHQIFDLEHSAKGSVHVSTDAGIYQFSLATQQFEQIKKLTGEHYGLVSIKDGSIWTSNPEKIYRFDPNTAEIKDAYSRYLPVSNGNTLRTARKWLQDSEGTLWYIDHWARLQFIKNESHSYGDIFSLAQDSLTQRFIEITGMADDPEHQQMIVTSSHGVATVAYEDHKTKWLPLSAPSRDLSRAHSTAIVRQKEEKYLLIIENQLYALAPEQLALSPIGKNGNPWNKSLKWILPAKDDQLWIGTFDGLISYNEKRAVPSIFYRNDNISEGTLMNPAPAIWAADKIVMAGNKGLTMVEPSKIIENPVAPIVRVESIRFPWRPKKGKLTEKTAFIGTNDSFDLEYYQNRISFKFVGIHYKDPGLHTYQYQLQGFDADWVDAGNKREAIYTNLSPGDYYFKVKAANADGVWSEPSEAILLQIKAPWWATWWAKFMYLILGALAIYGYNRYSFYQKLEKYKATEAVRTKLSADLHDDVGSILSGLSMKSELMSMSADASQQKELSLISELSKKAMEHMRDTVWAIDARKDKFENLADRMQAHGREHLDLKGFKFDFEAKMIDPQGFINPEIRQNLYFIFKEAITNILKYSNGDLVKVDFVQDEKWLRLRIFDNGNMVNAQKTDGLGLSNIYTRTEQLQGKCHIDTENGFEIKLEIPLKN